MGQNIQFAPIAPPETADREHRPKRWLMGIVAAVAIIAGVLAFLLTRAAAPPAPVSDVPRRVGDAIEVSDAFLRTAGIATAPATSAPLTPNFRVVGAAAFDPTHVATVGTRAPGIVTSVFYVEGDIVERNALLAEVDSTVLMTAQADLRIANAKKAAARANYERERDLFARQLTTAREYEQAQAALAEQKALSRGAAERVEAFGGAGATGVSQLRAPVAGVIAKRSIAPGQSVEPGLAAFRVGDLDELWVLLRVFERHLEHVRAGDPVDIRKIAEPTEIIRGEVAHVGSVIDPTTRTADVRVVVPNAARLLRPGQAVEATIHAGNPARVALSVPESAVTFVDGKPTVFVAESAKRFVPRPVETGIDGGDRIEITQGVRDGEVVVTQSVLALKSELFR